MGESMKKISTLLVSISMIFLSACASVNRNYVPEVKKCDFPQLNVQTTVYVGEEMLIQGTELRGKVLNVKQPVDGVCYDINAGKYPIVGSDAKKYYFSLHDGVTKAALCDPAEGLYVSKKDDKQICVVTIYGGTACYDAIFDIKDYNVVSADHIQRTLIFSGKKGNTVEFMYAEKSGLQTLMTHNVSYDLSKTSVIGYKGARIQIISCTNESITYIVLKNFPDRQ